MPLTRVSLIKGKSPEYRRAILDNVYLAMREAFGVPEEDRFMILTEHDKNDFVYGADYLGITRDDDLVMIQIYANNTRTTEQKKALYARIAELLKDKPGVKPENVLISLVEVAKENWSFGHGLAQYA